MNLTAMARSVMAWAARCRPPDPNQTKPVKEVWRHALNKQLHRKNKNYVGELGYPPGKSAVSGCVALGLYETPAR